MSRVRPLGRAAFRLAAAGGLLGVAWYATGSAQSPTPFGIPTPAVPQPGEIVPAPMPVPVPQPPPPVVP